MSTDKLQDRKFMLLNVADDYNRQILSMETDLFIPALELIQALEYVKAFGLQPSLLYQALDSRCW